MDLVAQTIDTKKELLLHIAEKICSLELPYPTRVVVDGPLAAGKSMFANNLADILSESGRPIIRLSADDFHFPKEVRYRRGRESAEGYYFDAYDYNAMIKYVFEPLGPGGNLQYSQKIIDLAADRKIDSPSLSADPHSILLMDGVFLLRRELVAHSDVKIFIDTNFEITIERAVSRDTYLGNEFQIREMYAQRYVPAMRIYLESSHPKKLADFIVNNDDFEHPRLVLSSSKGNK